MNHLFLSINMDTSTSRYNPFISQLKCLSYERLAVLFCKAFKSPFCYILVERKIKGVSFLEGIGATT